MLCPLSVCLCPSVCLRLRTASLGTQAYSAVRIQLKKKSLGEDVEISGIGSGRQPFISKPTSEQGAWLQML